ncbi:relaxase/mobilization nuclease domain-containing protein [Streptococcus sp. S784/96/1]|uniref:relaxase/mobilization nuclease domain-containing protein n=1 Tax=Streptococcus sp. S784/96/1 TaxID=2653499 RepID=UPI00138676F4|nr:relaxase/mobilization nuclease domain-containing protein [Streptococcus sp. S784/96/1]
MVVTKVFQIKHVHKLDQTMKYIEDLEKTAKETNTAVSEAIEVQHVAGYFSYITNDQKTMLGEQHQLVSCYGVVSHETAADEFLMTRLQAKQVLGNRGNGQDEVLAHHLIQSFSPDDDLTPEQVHEIGRKTVLELTGGQHEFVIATHMDKGHLHNHIIFNTTNSVTLTKFRWQKGTKLSFEKISDKHAELAGAKIITQKMKGSRQSYAAYRTKNSHRYEVKERLNFLIKHSTSWEDFLAKAKALELHVDSTGKEVKYRCLDREDVERNVRDGSLSRRGNYSQEAITKRVEQNEPTLTVENIKQAYRGHKAAQDNEFEMRLTIEPWQVMAEVEQGIYLEVDYGLANSGTVLIPSRCLEKTEQGAYELFIKKSDYFYFMNPDNSKSNRFMTGDVLAKQISYDNGELIIKKSPHISRLDNLIKEFNFLSAHGVTSGQQFEELVEQFRRQVNETQAELDKLDNRLADLNKAGAALMALETGEPNQVTLAQDILAQLNLSQVDKIALDKLAKETIIERQALRARFDQIISSHRQYQAIKDNVKARDQDKQL